MNSDILAFLLPFLVVGLLAIIVAEVVLSLRWTPFYYRSGLIIYRRYHEFPILPHADLDVHLLNRQFQSSFIPSVVFRKIGPGEYAFRERLLQVCLLTYTPIMKGHIVVKPETRSAIVEGRLEWSSMAFPVCFLGISALSGGSSSLIMTTVFLGFIMACLYSIQMYRFNEVGTFLNSMFLSQTGKSLSNGN